MTDPNENGNTLPATTTEAATPETTTGVPPPATTAEDAAALFLPVRHLDPDNPYANIEDADDLDDGSDRPDTLRVPVVKIVHGHERYEVPGDGLVESFMARIIDSHKCNALWLAEGDDGGINRLPDCSSPNGKHPRDGCPARQADTCIGCPQNEFGSAIGSDGQPTRGKACKNMRRLHMLLPGCGLPVRLTLTPTSLRAWEDFWPQVAAVPGRKFWHVATLFTLESRKAGSQEWSVVKMSLADVPRVTRDQAQALVQFIKEARPALRAQAITRDEYEGGGSDDSNFEYGENAEQKGDATE